MPPEFPPALMAEILCRLPVKSLLQFRCVSKPWCRFIDSPFFIRTHLNRSIQSRKNQFLIFSNSGSNAVQSIDLEFLETIVDLHNPLKCRSQSMMLRFRYRGGVIKPRFPSLPDDLQIIVPRWERSTLPRLDQVKVWGSSNGLVLMSGPSSICLWNPFTRKHRNLPKLDLPSPDKVYGFGYDSGSDDYKVIKILISGNRKEIRTQYGVWVYSLQSNSWREIRNSFPPNIEFESLPGVLVSEALHWPVKVKSGLDEVENAFILALDLKTEECRMFPHPVCQNAEFHSRLGAFNGSSLCLIYSYMPIGYEIWVMGESWTRVTLQRGDFISYPGGFINQTLRDGKEVMLHRNFKDTSRLFSQEGSIETEMFRKLQYKKSDVCVASLISPDGVAASAHQNEVLN